MCFVAVAFNVLVMSLCWIARIIYLGNSLLYLVTVSYLYVVLLCDCAGLTMIN